MAKKRIDRAAFRRQFILLEDERPFGELMDPWQAEDADALDSGLYPNAYLDRPRGHDKTGGIGTEAVCELVLGKANQRLYCFAADRDQAALLFQDVADKFQRHPHLRGLVKITANEITAKSGSKLRVMPSDVPSAWGLRPDWLAVDELSEWKRRDLWDALWTATGKRPHCRVLVITSAGWDRTSIAWEVRQIAEREPSWYFSSRGQCASWIRPEWLAEQKRTLPPHVYARLHENRWVDGVGAWLTYQQVDGIFGVIPEGDGKRVIGLDIGYARDRTALCVLRRCGPLAVVDHLELFHPHKDARVDLGEVQEAALHLARKYAAPIWFDPHQGILMAENLRKAGCQMREHVFSAESRRTLFSVLVDNITQGFLRARPNEHLRRELLQLEVKQTSGGTWRVDHRPTGFDDAAVAIGMALVGLGPYREGTHAPQGHGGRKTSEEKVWRERVDIALRSQT